MVRGSEAVRESTGQGKGQAGTATVEAVSQARMVSSVEHYAVVQRRQVLRPLVVGDTPASTDVISDFESEHWFSALCLT